MPLHALFLTLSTMKTGLNLLVSIIFAACSFTAHSQIITTDPAIPVATESITVYYDATLGTGGLKDFTGEVYAHTGVLTENSSNNQDWKYAPTWGDNSAKYKMTRLEANLYSLEITPSIREYYGVPESETITHMAFVFRSADNSKQGKADGGADIFVEVYEPGLNISIINPDKNQLLQPDTQLAFEAAVSESADITLYLNDTQVKSVTSTTITHTFDFDAPGDFWIKVTAATAEETDTDSVFIHFLGNQPEQPRPAGVKNGINYIDDQTVHLVLHAPGKEHLFAIGDFNGWTPRADARMTRDNEHWWITLTGLEPGTEYAYQYLVDGELQIADPYTEKVLDPNHDRWISDATYPDLKPYPSQYTSGITSVLHTAQEPYQWTNTAFTPPQKEKLVIYELLVRDFTEAHDWKTLTDTLNYFTELGINAIELLPFNEFEGNESWGYNPSFYFAPDKYYGPKEDLQVFIDSCHGRGIAVIMDMTLNHSFSQSPLVQLYYNEATNKVTAENPWYNVDSPNQDYFWGYDFDHESTATQEFVDRVNSHWLTEYNLDGFRFDFTKGFTNTPGDGWAYDAARIAILKRMADEVWNVNSDAYVIFEHLADNSEEKVLSDYGIMLWGNINHNYNEATMGYHTNGKSDFSWISYKKRGWNDPHLIGYMESHDEERLMFKNLEYGNSAGSYDIQSLNTALARQELAGAFFFTIPGPKMLWQFGELGYDYSIDYNGRVGNKPIRWDYYDVGKRRRLCQVWSALIHLRTTEPAFSTADYKLNVAYATKRIELNHEDMDVRIIGNFDVTSQTVDPNFSSTGKWYSYFEGTSMEVTDPNELVTLAPGEYRIYTTKQLAVPEITASVGEPRAFSQEIKLWPVPASNMLHVESAAEISGLRIFDVNGRTVKRVPEIDNGTIDVSGLKPGLYFIEALLVGGSTARSKFLVQ
jgi:glycosidase